jgi:hypothetical protein
MIFASRDRRDPKREDPELPPDVAPNTELGAPPVATASPEPHNEAITDVPHSPSYAPLAPPPPEGPAAPLHEHAAGLPLPAGPYAVTTALVVGLLDELAEVAAGAQGRAFLLAVGRRVAIRHHLGTPKSLADMEAQANSVLHMLGWGKTRLLAGPAGIRIMHHDWPSALAGDESHHWQDAFPIILSGVYHSWFSAIGGPTDLVTTVTAMNRKAIELQHGPRDH